MLWIAAGNALTQFLFDRRVGLRDERAIGFASDLEVATKVVQSNAVRGIGQLRGKGRELVEFAQAPCLCMSE